MICGNSIYPPEGFENVQKGSYGYANLNNDCYSRINEYLETLEMTLNKLTSYIDVDLMPGELDVSSAMVPQQPINRAMFPNLIKPERINFVTNPHEFCINGIRFLGTDGNNVKDIRMFAENHRNPVDIMEQMLQFRHICPTSPDTLRSYPFTQTDPFIIKSSPHVFFAGN